MVLPSNLPKKWLKAALLTECAPKKAMNAMIPMDDTEAVMLIDKWRDQAALDAHHKTPMMKEIATLREKYHLRMRVEKYTEIN